MPTIQKRIAKDGTVSYRVQVRIKGRPSETSTFDRLTDAKNWGQQTEADIKRGKYFKTAEAKKRTMAEAIDRYFDDVLSHRKNPVNQRTYLKWWKKQIGVYTLADVTSALVVEKRNALVGSENRFKRSVGKTTANRYTQALGHVFTIARKEWGWVSENPVANITKFKEPRGRVRFLSDEERTKLLEACKRSDNPYLYTIVILALSTGARKSEILNLKWEHVDFERGQIVLDETKNGERRSIPLQGYYVCQNRKCSHKGKSIRRDVLEGEFEALLKSITPSKPALKIADGMFRKLWTVQETAQKDRKAELEKQHRSHVQQIEKLVDRIVETESGAVLKLAFSKRLIWDRKGMYRTPDLSLPFKVLGGFSGVKTKWRARRDSNP